MSCPCLLFEDFKNQPGRRDGQLWLHLVFYAIHSVWIILCRVCTVLHSVKALLTRRVLWQTFSLKTKNEQVFCIVEAHLTAYFSKDSCGNYLFTWLESNCFWKSSIKLKPIKDGRNILPSTIPYIQRKTHGIVLLEWGRI